MDMVSTTVQEIHCQKAFINLCNEEMYPLPRVKLYPEYENQLRRREYNNMYSDKMGK